MVCIGLGGTAAPGFLGPEIKRWRWERLHSPLPQGSPAPQVPVVQRLKFQKEECFHWGVARRPGNQRLKALARPVRLGEQAEAGVHVDSSSSRRKRGYKKAWF